jgi:hypothetical protein
MEQSRIFLLFGARGPVLAMTKDDLASDRDLLDRLAAKTTDKFIAFEVKLESIKIQYREHFAHLLDDPKQQSDVRILDDDGDEIFTNINFNDLSNPLYYDPETLKIKNLKKTKT